MQLNVNRRSRGITEIIRAKEAQRKVKGIQSSPAGCLSTDMAQLLEKGFLSH